MEMEKHRRDFQEFTVDSLDSTNIEASFEIIDMIGGTPSPQYQPKYGNHARNTRVLGTLGVVAITYFYGCGGPIGTETIISAGGPLVAMIALVAYALCMSLPYAYMVAELCSAFPEDGGFTIWVLQAFGPFWAFQVGYWSWVAGIIVGAFMPAVVVQVITYAASSSITSDVALYFSKAAIAMVLTIPVLLGTKCISRLMITLMVVTLAPYLVFIGYAYATARDYDDLMDIRQENITVISREDVIKEGPIYIDWSTLINGLFWNFDGINIASLFGGEVRNPAHVYSHAIFIVVALSLITIIIPVPAAVASGGTHWAQYVQGSYLQVADEIGGSGMQLAIVISSICTLSGLFMSSLFSKSFEMSGMAQKQLLPSFFAKKNERFGSPHVAVLTTAGCIIALSEIEFSRLISVSNAFACAVELLILFSVIRLRYTLPYIARPTKVPGGVPALVIMAIFPVAVFTFIIYTTCTELFGSIMLIVLLLPGLVYGGYKFYLKEV